MPKPPAPFIGFEEPKKLLNSHSWDTRLDALAEPANVNRWAKFGPYKSTNSIYNIKAALKKSHLYNVGFGLDFTFEEEDGLYYIYVRVTKRGR
jgi:hypothetical protein